MGLLSFLDAQNRELFQQCSAILSRSVQLEVIQTFQNTYKLRAGYEPSGNQVVSSHPADWGETSRLGLQFYHSLGNPDCQVGCFSKKYPQGVLKAWRGRLAFLSSLGCFQESVQDGMPTLKHLDKQRVLVVAQAQGLPQPSGHWLDARQLKTMPTVEHPGRQGRGNSVLLWQIRQPGMGETGPDGSFLKDRCVKAEAFQQRSGPGPAGMHQHPSQFTADALAANAFELARVCSDGMGRLGFDFKSKPGGETHGAQGTKVVFGQPTFGVSHGSDDPGFKVR